MIIIKLTGGLGNQMFQYAFARKLSVLKNVPIKLDIFWYLDSNFGKDTKREYALKLFDIQENIATREDVAPFLAKRSLIHRFIKKFKRDILNIDDFGFNPKLLATKNDVYFDDHCQSEKYFIDIADVLRKEFILKDGLSLDAQVIQKQILTSNSVSLHIRRGDYVSDKNANTMI
ncbi:MAG: alpha-1,2-fucosyltransferase, partial [Candidatus Falkowbacteria bacterium]|nr:alpha-1,2-fucosyltransferase [Candidatus Falkowbacteria bacterium]